MACEDHYCNGDLTSGSRHSRSVAAWQSSYSDFQESQGEAQLARQGFQHLSSQVYGAQTGSTNHNPSASQRVEALGADYGNYVACLKNNANYPRGAGYYCASTGENFRLIYDYLNNGGSQAALAGSTRLGAQLCKSTGDCGGISLKQFLGLLPLVAGTVTGGEADPVIIDAEEALGAAGEAATSVEAAADASAEGFLESAAGDEAESLPMQMHHFATNKNSVYTPRMQSIADRYGLNLDDAWNRELMPHLGRHPNAYHEFVLDGMELASREAGVDTTKFLDLFDQYVRQPVLNNPELLRSSGWG